MKNLQTFSYLTSLQHFSLSASSLPSILLISSGFYPIRLFPFNPSCFTTTLYLSSFIYSLPVLNPLMASLTIRMKPKLPDTVSRQSRQSYPSSSFFNHSKTNTPPPLLCHHHHQIFACTEHPCYRVALKRPLLVSFFQTGLPTILTGDRGGVHRGHSYSTQDILSEPSVLHDGSLP